MPTTVVCPNCNASLSIPTPEESGLEVIGSVECDRCYQVFAIEPAPRRNAPAPADVPSYTDKMLAEQLVEQQHYDQQMRARFGASEREFIQRSGFIYGIKMGVAGVFKTLIELTSAIAVLFFFIGICAVSFVGGWLVGDELFFFLSKILKPAVQAIFG